MFSQCCIKSVAVRQEAATFGHVSSDPSKVTHSGHSTQRWIRPLNLWRLWLDSRTACHWVVLLGRLILYLCSEFFSPSRFSLLSASIRSESQTQTADITLSDDLGFPFPWIFLFMEVYWCLVLVVWSTYDYTELCSSELIICD